MIDDTPHDPVGQRPDASVPAGDFTASRSLKRQLVEELRSGWAAGHPAKPEALLARWPSKPESDPDVASLLFVDYCQRRAHGEDVSPEEYDRRFPSCRNSVAGLWEHQAFLRSLAGDSVGSSLTLALPEVGDEVFGFRLIRELGRGSFARVFCAHQDTLAGRAVVVKVSTIAGDEPQTLAQLQHTNIVPIYSVHEDVPAGLRVVCMPYFGGASLSRVLQELWSRDEVPVSGSELVRALAQCDSSSPDGEPASQDSAADPRVQLNYIVPTNFAPLTRLASRSYIWASACIVARLAEALQHAHGRGVLHRDIKPSNVLLGADGEPMLLDFNLAQHMDDSRAQLVATLGGTVAYMAPEHLRALAGRDPALVGQVDQRADVYGLGMVLYEMLTGCRPFDQSASYSPMPALIEAMALERGRETPSLRERRPDVPWSLESIGRKCLVPDPALRYQSAAELAEDLRRFLEDRPLAYAPELSWAERMGKWVRRHPRLTTAASISAAAVLALSVGAAAWRDTANRLDIARAAEARELSREFHSGADRARCLINTGSEFADHVREGMILSEQTLGRFGVLDRHDWQEQPTYVRLDADEQRWVAEDARELLLLLARARVHTSADRAAVDSPALAPEGIALSVAFGPGLQSLAPWVGAYDKAQAKLQAIVRAKDVAYRDGLHILDRADAVTGLPRSRAVWSDRASYLEQLGELDSAKKAAEIAAGIAESDARDHYLLAQALFQKGDYSRAVVELKLSLRVNSRHYWSHLLMGMCQYELRDPAQAAESARVCTILWPEAPWGFFNHGRAVQQLGKDWDAVEDYTAALERKPDFGEVHINRGLVYLNLHKPDLALADFDAAVAQGYSQVVVHGGRGIALEGLGRTSEADAAFERAWQADSANVPMMIGYGFAVERRLPDKAEAAFQRALDREPRNPRALYGYAMLLARQKRDSDLAATCFTLALEADPGFMEARSARANVLAHRGDWERARQDIDRCVKENPTGGMLYAAACVYAISARKCPGSQAALFEARSIEFLTAALARGYGSDLLADDQDLVNLRHHPQFSALLRKGSTRKQQAQDRPTGLTQNARAS
jgi:serine/threonine protein kinase/Tfp pilus assembly protein PilF